MNAVALDSVSKSLGGKPVVRDFTLAVPPGERLAILGPSGCGKTTVLRLLAGLLAPDGGSIEISGQLVAQDGRNLVEPEDRGVGMVFQDLALWPHLSVRGNLEFGLKAKGVRRSERQSRMARMLDLVHLTDYAAARPAELSGGQQQRAALARALVMQPKVILMDEPLSSQDRELRLELRTEITRLQELIGFTLIYVTHDLDEAFHIAARVVLMRNGAIEADGTADETRRHLTSTSPSWLP